MKYCLRLSQICTFLCWQLADIHGFIEDFNGQSECWRKCHLSFLVVLLQHGHGCLWAKETQSEHHSLQQSQNHSAFSAAHKATVNVFRVLIQVFAQCCEAALLPIMLCVQLSLQTHWDDESHRESGLMQLASLESAESRPRLCLLWASTTLCVHQRAKHVFMCAH